MLKKFFINIAVHFEDYACTGFMMIMCVATFLQVLFRIVFKNPLIWTQELATFSFIWLCFLAIAWAEKKRSHFCVDVFAKCLKGKARQLLEILDDVLACAIYVLLIYWSIMYYPMQAVITTSALLISRGLIEATMIVSFSLCFIHRAAALIDNVKILAGKKEVPDQ